MGACGGPFFKILQIIKFRLKDKEFGNGCQNKMGAKTKWDPAGGLFSS